MEQDAQYDPMSPVLTAFLLEMAEAIDLPDALHCEMAHFTRFCDRIRDTYDRTVPYHCFAHAVDVAHVYLTLLLQLDASSASSVSAVATDPMDRAMVFLAAIAHDAGHPGTNNAHQMAMGTPLAKYGPHGTLEKYAVDVGWRIFEESGIGSSLAKNAMERAKRVFAKAILETDMDRHGASINALTQMEGTANLTEEQHALLMHAADLSTPTRRPFQCCLQRSIQCQREFIQQGDIEKAAGLEPPDTFDRVRYDDTGGKELFRRCELDFAQHCVRPYLTALIKVWPALQYLVTNLDENVTAWQHHALTEWKAILQR